MSNHLITLTGAERAFTARPRRVVAALLSASALLTAGAGPALADPGSPGSTFPERPGNNLAGCNAILNLPTSGIDNNADVAANIVTGLTVDACFGGP